MNKNIPRTPVSTPLSGSARETEIRLKNIFSGPKKRPPLLFLALMFSVCIFCGNLVSCQVAEPEEGDAPARLENSQQGDTSLEEFKPQPVTYKQPELPLGDDEQVLLDALFRAAEREGGYRFQIPTVHLLNSMEKDGWLLGAVFVEDHLENTLILGIMDRETGEVPHAVFQCSYHIGVPNVVIFQNYDGEDCLLYTFNGQENGQYTGEAGMLRFDGEFMTWQWPVEGDVRYGKEPPGAAPAAFSEYQEYWWNGHLALMAPGGVDIYTINPDFEWGKDDPWSRWQLETDELFYGNPSSAAELPMPIYFDALRWLIEYTGDPGGWRITSLVLDEERSDPEETVDCYILQAMEEHGTGELTASLFFPYESEPTRPRIYDNLHHGEIYESYDTLPGQRVNPFNP